MFNPEEKKRCKVYIYVTCVCGEKVEVDDIIFRDNDKYCPKCKDEKNRFNRFAKGNNFKQQKL